MSHTSAILDFAAAPHVLPDAVRADTLRLLADTLAVGAAGHSIWHIFDHSHDGRVRTLDGCNTLPADSAAFNNGYAIHSLEWDAVHEPAVVHALSVVTASLLAMSDQRRGSDPDHFLTCLAIGVDVAAGLGIAATGPMRFFRPATAGIIGGAIAVARFIKLSRSAYDDVMGFAYSFAGGTMQAHVEASVALPLQIANAARSAITAVELVAHSEPPAPHDVLEGPFGYSALFEPLDLVRYTADLGKVWRISEVSIKPFPSGRASHAILATVADIRESVRSIDRLTAHIPPLIMRLVGRPFAAEMTPAYARLCLPLLVALMLRDGRIDPRRFTSETFADPLIRELAGKISIVLDDNPDGNALGPQRLDIAYADGSSESINIPHALGSPDAPMSPAQLAAKYDLCRALAPDCDPRIFDDPLSYATNPR
jgi:2-methylcitrate dehydratase PrpD